jgi:hypothetical protein
VFAIAPRPSQVDRPTPRALRIAGLALVALLAVLVMPMSASGKAGPVILPANSHPFGKTYGEWSAEWWKQAYAVDTTVAGQPFGTGQVDCAQLGVRNVVFLVGTTLTTGPSAERSCTVPPGRALLIPLINAECSEAVDGMHTYADRLDCARGYMNQVVTSSLELIFRAGDEPPVKVPASTLASFRFDSPPFTWTSGANSPFPVDAFTNNPAAANGFYVMLAPLPPGSYDITFGGEAPGLGFSTMATYHLTVR